MGLFDFFNSNGYNSQNDRCINMLNNATFNPLHITNADPSHKIPSLVSVFRSELMGQLNNTMLVSAMGKKQIVKSYIFNLVESYYNNAGFVPSNMVDEMIKQVYQAIEGTSHITEIGTHDNLRYEMYYAFLHN